MPGITSCFPQSSADVQKTAEKTAQETLKAAGVKEFKKYNFVKHLLQAKDPLEFAKQIKALEHLKIHRWYGFSSREILNDDILQKLAQLSNPKLLSQLIIELNNASATLLTTNNIQFVADKLYRYGMGKAQIEVTYLIQKQEVIKVAADKKIAESICQSLYISDKQLVTTDFVTRMLKSKDPSVILTFVNGLAGQIPATVIHQVCTEALIKLVINNIEKKEINDFCDIILFLHKCASPMLVDKNLRELIIADDKNEICLNLILNRLGVISLQQTEEFKRVLLNNFMQLKCDMLHDVLEMNSDINFSLKPVELQVFKLLCLYVNEHTKVVQLIMANSNSATIIERAKILYFLHRLQPNLMTDYNMCKIYSSDNYWRELLILFLEDLKINTRLESTQRFIDKTLEKPQQLLWLVNSDSLSLAASRRNILPELLALDTVLAEQKAFGDLQREIAKRGGEQMAWRPDKVKYSKYVFSKVEEKYKSVFIAEPYKSDLNYVEKEIKNLILDEILRSSKIEVELVQKKIEATNSNSRLDEAKKKTALNSMKQRLQLIQESINFITESKEALVLGQTESLNTKARELFVLNDMLPMVAWRCYDLKAPWVKWPNLLTPTTDSATKVYNGEGEPQISQKDASDQARYVVALYYLAVVDVSAYEVKDCRQQRIERFVAKLAEIRRAHNDDGGRERIINTTDNTSCLPGFYTRMPETIHGRTDIQVLSLEQATLDKLKAIINLELIKLIGNGSQAINEQERIKRLKQYYACKMLGLANAKDVLAGREDFHEFEGYLVGLPDETMALTEAVQLRRKFLSRFKLSVIQKQIDLHLKQLGIPVDAQKIEYLIIRSFLDLSANIPCLSAAQHARLIAEPQVELATSSTLSSGLFESAAFIDVDDEDKDSRELAVSRHFAEDQITATDDALLVEQSVTIGGITQIDDDNDLVLPSSRNRAETQARQIVVRPASQFISATADWLDSDSDTIGSEYTSFSLSSLDDVSDPGSTFTISSSILDSSSEPTVLAEESSSMASVCATPLYDTLRCELQAQGCTQEQRNQQLMTLIRGRLESRQQLRDAVQVVSTRASR